MAASVTPIVTPPPKRQSAAQRQTAAPEWFGLEKEDDAPDALRRWNRVRTLEPGDRNYTSSWPINACDPHEVALRLGGPGVYRVLWLGGPKKARLGSDVPFRVEPDEPIGVETPAPASPRVQPINGAPIGAAPAPLRQVASVMQGVLPAGTTGNDPIAIFAMVHGLSMQSTQMLIETMRIGQQQAMQSQQEFFASMLAMQSQGFQQVRSVETDAQARIAEAQRAPDASAAVVEAIEKLRAQLEEDEDDEEDEEATPAAPAPVDPGQAERIIGAFGGVLDGLNKLGLGPVIQKVIAHKMGVDIGAVAANVEPIG